MPAKVRDMRRMLTQKLQAVESPGSGHNKYLIIHEGTLVARTVLSRSYTEIDDSLLSAIARQLLINTNQLRHLMDCSLSREEYFAVVLGD